mgnify:CR=1 FL=1
MRILFSLIVLCVIHLSLVAQEKTKVRLYVKGSSDYFIRLDGEMLPHTNLQLIEPGEHTLEVWSPMHLLHTGKIDVPQKDSISYYQKLERDPEYVKYLFDTDAFKRKMLFGKTLPLMASGAGMVGAPIFYFLRKRDHEVLVKENFKSDYNIGGDLDNAQSRYAISNGLFFTSVGFAVGGAVTYFILRNKLNNTEKPNYKQKNPFTLEDFELSYHPLTGTPQAGVTLRF